MSESRDLILETAERLFGDHCVPEAMREADAGEIPGALWRALEEAGFTRALVPAEAGGAGLELGDALSLLIPAGRHALPAPLAETLLASWLLTAAGVRVPDGMLTVAPWRAAARVSARRDGSSWRLDGTATRVPWARHCEMIAVLAEADGERVVALVAAADCRITAGRNVAGEARDEVDFAGVTARHAGASQVAAVELQALGAVMRSAQMAGALQRILAITVQYAQERVQFGRPIGRFQAVQQNLAVLAGQAAAATAAAQAAIEAAGNLDSLAIACAKVRAGEAAGIGAAIAHQIHGAIGFTQEYHLHRSTRRLWAWRDEFGNEAWWSRRIGARLAAAGADRLWQTLTAAT
jgi:acyl-CoA dehydrogenase